LLATHVGSPLDTILASPFGNIERLIRGADQAREVRCRVGHRGHPDARRHPERLLSVPPADPLSLDPRPDALGQLAGAVEPGLGKQEHELLASVSRWLVHAAGLRAQDLADHLKDRISLWVTIGVVDLLEIVDVQHQQGEVVTEPVGAGRLLAGYVAEVP